jgi:hypothetical protein
MITLSRAKRRAYMLVEILMAGVLVGLSMAMTVKLLSTTVNQRRLAERRGWAIQESANVMERLTALPFPLLNTASARKEAKLSASAEAVLPGGRVEVEVREVDDGVAMKRIHVDVIWHGPSKLSEPPVRLTSFVVNKESPR